MLERARAGGRLAIDTEFMRERTYRAQLCLVQVAYDDEPHLVDPTSGIDLADIAKLIAEPDVEVVVHAGRQDLEIFHELYGVVPTKVVDVQVAAGFAGLGANLPYGRLVHELTGTNLQKGEAYSDWCKRPLSANQLRYAGDDVRYLLAMADELDRRTRELGRSDWVREEMRVFEDAETYAADPHEAWKRVSGRGTLTRTQMTVLKEVAAWREEAARRRDLPRGWVVKDQTLVEIARRMPTSVGKVKDIRGMNGREADRSGREIVAAVERGQAAPPVKLPTPPPRSAQMRARMLAGVADAIVRARSEHAGVATELVATRSELEAVLADVTAGRVERANHRLLQGWRRDLAGDAVVALAEGRVAVKVTNAPPYIEEIEL